MTDFNNKFIINTPKTYEVRYLENKGVSNLSKFASYLGLSVAYNCSTCGVSDKKLELQLDLRNSLGNHLKGAAYNTNQAQSESSAILAGTGSWEGTISTGCFRKKNRESLVNQINDKIKEHMKDGGKEIIRTLYAG